MEWLSVSSYQAARDLRNAGPVSPAEADRSEGLGPPIESFILSASFTCRQQLTPVREGQSFPAGPGEQHPLNVDDEN
jgi:hypothetical protein